jgi:hypothetical protein
MATKMPSVSRSTSRVQGVPVESETQDYQPALQPEGLSEELRARIAARAYMLYQKHGREDGHALEDWLEAERQVLSQDS